MGWPATPLLFALGLWGAFASEPECADEAWQRQVLAQARAFELHASEETLNDRLAQDLQVCGGGPGGASCRARAQSRHQSDRQTRRGEIDDRYQRLLRELEDRCHSSTA